MSAARHTPGPWGYFSDGRIFAREHGDIENARIVGEAFVGYLTIPSSVALANARLMAAAPDMLKLLRKLYAIEMNSDVSAEIAAVIARADLTS
jgi:hypothetical protein